MVSLNIMGALALIGELINPMKVVSDGEYYDNDDSLGQRAGSNCQHHQRQ